MKIHYLIHSQHKFLKLIQQPGQILRARKEFRWIFLRLYSKEPNITNIKSSFIIYIFKHVGLESRQTQTVRDEQNSLNLPPFCFSLSPVERPSVKSYSNMHQAKTCYIQCYLSFDFYPFQMLCFIKQVHDCSFLNGVPKILIGRLKVTQHQQLNETPDHSPSRFVVRPLIQRCERE